MRNLWQYPRIVYANKLTSLGVLIGHPDDSYMMEAYHAGLLVVHTTAWQVRRVLLPSSPGVAAVN